MSYRFYIIHANYGEVLGTDDESVAKYWSDSEEDYVIDATDNKWLMDKANKVDIKEQKKSTYQEDEE